MMLLKAIDFYAQLRVELKDQMKVEEGLYRDNYSQFEDYTERMNQLYAQENVILDMFCMHGDNDVLFRNAVDNRRPH